jgi:hypothetical protein
MRNRKVSMEMIQSSIRIIESNLDYIKAIIQAIIEDEKVEK